jgi:tetratricopeptide (TPR) repeat protein
MATVDPGSTLFRRTWLHVALLVVLPLVVFANSLHGELQLDDVYRVGQNPEIEVLHPMGRHFVDPRTSASLPQLVQYRPLLPLSLSVNLHISDALGIERLVGFHLGNLVLHIAGVLLLYAFFRELLKYWSGGSCSPRSAPHIALAAAALYAVHPITGASVNYVCGRDLLMMLAFLTGALLVYVRWRRLGGGLWRWPLFILLLSCSLCSKTNALVAPLLILVFEFTCASQGPLRPLVWLRALPAAAVALAYYLFTEYGLEFSDASQLLIDRGSVFEYPLTQMEVHLTHYLRNVVWPFFLRAEVHVEPASGLSDPGVLVGGLFILATLVVALRCRRSSPLVSFCIGGYWTMFLLTSSILPMRRLVTDYRQVPSLAFLCLVVAYVGYKLLGGRLRSAVAVVAVVALGASSIHLNRNWRTAESFWLQSIRHGGSALAHNNYGLSVKERDPALAEKHFRKTLEMYPRHVYGLINLGLLLIQQGSDEGLEYVRRAVSVRPQWGLSHYWLALSLEEAGDEFEAASAAERSAQLDPRNPKYLAAAKRLLYAAALRASREQDLERSLEFLDRLQAHEPGYGDSLFLEGFVLQKMKREAEAIDRYRLFLADNTSHVQAEFNLGYALMDQGEPSKAIQHFERALVLRPEYNEVHRHLATCYTLTGDEKKGAEHERAYRQGRGLPVDSDGQ